jgi:hypothetical protein
MHQFCTVRTFPHARDYLCRLDIWFHCYDKPANRSEQRTKEKTGFWASFALANDLPNKAENHDI